MAARVARQKITDIIFLICSGNTDSLPKGPFHTKNAIATEIVVFATAVVFYYLYRFAVIFPQEKTASRLLSR